MVLWALGAGVARVQAEVVLAGLDRGTQGEEKEDPAVPPRALPGRLLQEGEAGSWVS